MATALGLSLFLISFCRGNSHFIEDSIIILRVFPAEFRFSRLKKSSHQKFKKNKQKKHRFQELKKKPTYIEQNSTKNIRCVVLLYFSWEQKYKKITNETYPVTEAT